MNKQEENVKQLKQINYDIDECVKAYMKSIKKYTSLKKEEEHRLIKLYKKNNDIDARNKLITSNLKYACKIANKFRNRGIPFSQLISEANNALIYAIDKFDERNDVKIISYAKWWINQQLHKITENNIEALENELPQDTQNQLFNDFDECVDNESCSEYYNKYGFSNGAFAEESRNSITSDVNQIIEGLYNGLDNREIQIVNMKYGIFPYEKEFTLEEIGSKLKLTKERVRQILEKSKTKMRTQAMMTDCIFLSK